MLPPHDITLRDATGPVGWIAGNRLGFTGFADTAEASAAAWIACLALERRLAKRQRGSAPQAKQPQLYLVRSGEREWIEAPGKRLALLLRPDRSKSQTVANEATEASASWYGLEIVFPADTSKLTMRSSGYVIYRGLRRSGLRWSIRSHNPAAPMTALEFDNAPQPAAREADVADSQGPLRLSSMVPSHDDGKLVHERVILNHRDIIDDAAFDSFPASDPPPWCGFRVGPPNVGRVPVSAHGTTTHRELTESDRGRTVVTHRERSKYAQMVGAL
jgi:hypothetical protein